MQLFTIHYNPRQPDGKYQNTRKLWCASVMTVCLHHEATVDWKHEGESIDKSRYVVYEEDGITSHHVITNPISSEQAAMPTFTINWNLNDETGEYITTSIYHAPSVFSAIESHLSRTNDLKGIHSDCYEQFDLITPDERTLQVVASYYVKANAYAPTFVLKIES